MVEREKNRMRMVVAGSYRLVGSAEFDCPSLSLMLEDTLDTKHGTIFALPWK